MVSPDAPSIATPYKPNTEKSVAVSTDYYWNEDMATCPVGQKVQLLTQFGVAIYSSYNGHDAQFVAWAPLPRRKE